MAGNETDKNKIAIEEKAEPKKPEISEEDFRALATAYARFLKEHDLKPGDAAFGEPEKKPAAASKEAAVPEQPKPEEKSKAPTQEGMITVPAPVETEKTDAVKAEDDKIKTEKKAAAEEAAGKALVERAAKEEKKNAGKKKKAKSKEKKTLATGNGGPLAALIDLHDTIQDGSDEHFVQIGKDFAKGTHTITSSYRNSRRSIGIALLIVGVFAATLLIIFDHFTVYEYAYNGKILGYVSEQEEVTDVLGVAGRKLSQNTSGDAGVEFVANQNVTFNLVDARGKSTDDADTAVNKLIYMTDIETEAFAVYDGDRVVAIVKDSNSGEELLNRTMEELSRPDSGMTLVSSEFTNTLDIQPVNVLLGSVQSNEEALDQMVKGGSMEIYHIVEEGETVESLAAKFGVEAINIYDEDNENIATELEQGDGVCIRITVDPVSVKMVETGRLKEVIEYETIKKESDEYYKGDSFVEQEGQDGVQIFEGTLTKVAGEVTKRDETSIEVIKKKKNKIILVGTAERPKTAPTGTFARPINSYVVTSEFGGRWGRHHDGIDLGASTGTPIYASDGGTVTRATYYSGYGLCVDIDHENGRMTRYGHCSKLLVRAGDRVYQGQEIALVGNTGHSFGSHLHFEIRVGGSLVNPRRYVDF